MPWSNRRASRDINPLVADVRRAKTFYERVFGLQELSWDGPRMSF